MPEEDRGEVTIATVNGDAAYRDRAPDAGYPYYADDDARYGQDGFTNLLHMLLGIWRRNRWLILGIIALALVAAVIVTLLQTPRYTALASVQIDDQGQQVLGEEFDQQSEATPSGQAELFLNTQLEILRSRSLAERVMRKLQLEGSERFYAAMGESPPEADISRTERREKVLELLQTNMSASLPRNTRIARIGFTSTDPQMSARIANAFAEEFIQANLQRRFDGSAYARNFTSERLEEARVRLEASERELNAYARQAGLIRGRNSGGGDKDSDAISGSVTVSSLMQVNEAANQAEAARIAAEGRWRTEQSTPIFSSRAVLENPTVQALMTRRAELEGQLEVARARYLPDHPQVKQSETELKEVRQQLNGVAASVRNSIKSDYEAALAAEQRLREQVRKLKGDTLAEQDRSVRYNTLAREADTNRSIYEGLLQRYRELNASAGISSSNLSIIDVADTPLEPTSPSLPLNLAWALAVGILLAGLVAFLRDQLDDTVRVPDDLEDKLGLPLLGVIPDSEGSGIADSLSDPTSPVAEAYGSLRGVLLYATRSGLPRLIQVTSAQPAEGKSTSAYAIASGYARQGRKVLLVDADLRRPSVHRVAGLENRRGLSSLLVSDDPASSAIVPSGEPNFSVLPSGPIPPSPTELLTAPRMAALLEELAGTYEVVVIDSPPVLGLADAPALAALVDGVVFVVEAQRGRRGALKTALRRLKAVDAMLLGAVLTKFDAAKAGGGAAEYYGYDQYRYASNESPAR